YNVFHRQDIHAELLRVAISEEGQGTPCEIVVDHICESVNLKKRTVSFKNGTTIIADLIIGADGRRSTVRSSIGIFAGNSTAPQTCYRLNVLTKDIKDLGLAKHVYGPVMQYWGGEEGSNGRSKYYKVVTAPCHGGDVISFYCFMPTELTSHRGSSFEFKEASVSDILVGCFEDLEPGCKDLIKHSINRMPWRLYVHQPYESWHKGNVCLIGDAAHPMLPHQSQ
ncbi:hypothetical protein BDV98DRAFT_491496, partial [Pterulicium gracile]